MICSKYELILKLLELLIDHDYQLEEDELLAKAVQESLNFESPPQHTSGNIPQHASGNMYQPYLPQYQYGSRY